MYFSDMRLLTSDCNLELSYFGKPIQLRISEVTSQRHNYSNDESLSHDMSDLNLSLYEPVSGKFITSLQNMLKLELSSYVLEIPNYAYTTLSQNLIGYSTLSQGYCRLIG